MEPDARKNARIEHSAFNASQFANVKMAPRAQRPMALAHAKWAGWDRHVPQNAPAVTMAMHVLRNAVVLSMRRVTASMATARA